jgi:hypothetical protein
MVSCFLFLVSGFWFLVSGFWFLVNFSFRKGRSNCCHAELVSASFSFAGCAKWEKGNRYIVPGFDDPESGKDAETSSA